MLTCKQVSRALAEEDYQSMTLWRKLGLRLHVGLCFVCGKYNRNVMLFQDMARAYRNYEETQGPTAPDEKKQKWKEKLESANRR